MGGPPARTPGARPALQQQSAQPVHAGPQDPPGGNARPAQPLAADGLPLLLRARPPGGATRRRRVQFAALPQRALVAPKRRPEPAGEAAPQRYRRFGLPKARHRPRHCARRRQGASARWRVGAPACGPAHGRGLPWPQTAERGSRCRLSVSWVTANAATYRSETRCSARQLKVYTPPGICRCALHHLELPGTRLVEPALVDPFEETTRPMHVVRPECSRYGREAVVDVQLCNFLRQIDPAPVDARPDRRHAALQVFHSGTRWQRMVCRKPRAHPEHQRAKVFRWQGRDKFRCKSLEKPSPLHRTLLPDQVRGDVGARRHGNNLRHGASTSKLRARF